MKLSNGKRIFSLLLALCMVLTLVPGGIAQARNDLASYTPIDPGTVSAAPMEEPMEDTAQQPVYDLNETVRVFIVMEEPSVMEKGFSTANIASNTAAMNYRASLEAQQLAVARSISRQVALDVRWSLTLAANAMSANVRYCDIAAIEQVEGVQAVYLVPVYELDETETVDPNTVSGGSMVGSYAAWLDGYTGAGSRVAVIDTGIDSDHISFDSGAFEYGLLVSAVKNGKNVTDYDLLDEEEIAQVLPELHVAQVNGELTATDLYVNSKIPFGFNYIDENLSITHDNDGQSDHGTHVSGIATANRYVLQSDGTYAYAENGVAGIAPNAQLITMKVFGANGGAYADDYIAAIEDALLLNCDAVNLSLGSATVGFTTAGDAYIDDVMDLLTESDTVVSMSCGNSGYWSEYSNSPTGLLYTEDANTGRVGSPGAYENSLAVASADNTGSTGVYFTVAGKHYGYADGAGLSFVGGGVCRSNPFVSLDISEDKSGTEYDYVFLGDPTDPDDLVKYGGTAEDFATVDVTGKIVLVSRGNGVAFTDKQELAMDAGAAAIIVYNNAYGFDSIYAACNVTLPFITIRLDQMEAILADTAADENGVYGGKLRVMSGVYTDMNATGGVITMSSFSSWGVPGDLSMKPEITAPGGNIYSTMDNGTYGLMSGTSMASPAVAGMAAVVAQYIKENGLAQQEGITVRALSQSLLMGTAVATMDPNSEVEYSPRSQGSGLGNVASAVSSPTYITVDGNEDGKVKAELGDDPQRTGVYTFSFRVHNMTDAPVSYELDASVMAPGIVEYEGQHFVSMSNVALGADVAFTGNTACDFDGSGTVDTGDVLAILRHVTGTEALTPEKQTLADFDGSGAVEVLDAQILRDLLEGKSYGELTLAAILDQSAITVPAHGSTWVQVTMTLTEEGRAYLEDNFINGTYVEGYVYLRSVADEEGRLPVDQSIPFLGFYGNWTDSSMLDRVKYAEDHYDDTRAPYLGLYYQNFYSISFKGVSGSYRLGLNLYAQDDAYVADRAAISSEAQDTIASLTYSLVRNAEAVNFQITNAETGEVYLSQENGFEYGAFYHTNAGSWMYTSSKLPLGWKGTDAQGEPLPNNTKVLLTLTAAPEYNVAADGTISGLGEGAVWSFPVTIDNELPAVHQMFYSSDAITGSKLLNISAQDNQYIAAVQIFDETGSRLLGRLSPNQTEANAEVNLAVDVSQIYEDVITVVVVDYAGNSVGYSLELGNAGQEPVTEMNGFFAFLPSSAAWISFDEATTAEPVTVAETELEFSAAEYVDGHIFAADTNGYLYVMEHGKFQPETICNLGLVVQDMTYNRADGSLYALVATQDAEGVPQYGTIITIDLLTGEMKTAGRVENLEGGDTPQVLACDAEGTFYTITASSKDSKLYTFTVDENGGLTEPQLVGSTGQKANYLQTMAFDHSTGKLYWAHFYQAGIFSVAEKNLLEVNLETGATTVVGEMVSETTGMFIVRGAGAGFGDTDTPQRVTLNRESLTLYSGNSEVLEGFVTPWTLKDRSIIWTSSDPEVATVTTTGEVVGVKAGTAVITAASKADPTVCATCTVTVKELDATLSGIVYDTDGKVYFASIDADTADFTKRSDATGEDFLSASYVGDRLYATTQGAMYQVDPESGYEAERLCAMDFPVYDMAYSPNLDMALGVYGYYLLILDPEAEGGYDGGWNLSSMFSAIAGVTYAGRDSTYNYFYILSSTGNIYLTGIEYDGISYTLNILDMITTGVAISGQYSNQSLFYDGNTGWIYWSCFDGEATSRLVAVHEDTGEVILRGSFPDGVYPVVGLYGAESQAEIDRTGDFQWDSALRLADEQETFTSVAASPNGSIAGLDD